MSIITKSFLQFTLMAGAVIYSTPNVSANEWTEVLQRYDADIITVSGDLYTIETNDDGYVLTGVFPKFRPVNAGTASSDGYIFPETYDTIYLGINCDAVHSVFGAGTWSYNNVGWGGSFELGGGFFVLGDSWYHPTKDADIDCLEL